MATRPFQRMRASSAGASLPDGEGILLRPGGSIHTFFMRFPIDVVFLDRDLVVLGIASARDPGARPAGAARSRSSSSRAGECERRGIQVGDTLTLAP